MSVPTRPLNVLWLIDHVCYDGSLHGGGRLYANVIPQFDPGRVRVHPYFLRASREVQEVFRDAVPPVTNLGLGRYDPSTPWRIAALCRRHAIDVMHLFCYASSTFGRMVGAVRRLPTVVHDFDTQVYFPYPWYLRLLDRLLAPTTGHGYAASAMCAEYMRDTRRVPAERLEVLHHAIPSGQLARASQRDRGEARAALGLGTGPLFCAATKLGPERGNDALLDAFAAVHAAEPGARLVILYQPTLYHRLPAEYASLPWARDPGEMRARLERRIEALRLGGAVRLVESPPDPEAWYAAADVMVAPFENRRFSSVALVEAMAFGRPHVVSALGEPLELVERYGGGLPVPPGDPAALARAMLALVRDPALMAQLGEAARRGAGDLTVGAVAERLARRYEELHAARAGGVPATGRSHR